MGKTAIFVLIWLSAGLILLGVMFALGVFGFADHDDPLLRAFMQFCMVCVWSGAFLISIVVLAERIKSIGVAMVAEMKKEEKPKV